MTQTVGFRIEEELLARLDLVAKVRHGGNRSDALAAAVEYYVAHVGSCPRCGEICPEGASYCPKCACPLTAEARERVAYLKQSVSEHPEVVREALDEYIADKKRQGESG